jgi:glycerol-3-phosphate dehydrogenase (NAD(P)+)
LSNIFIIGGGSWGTTIANVIVEKKSDINKIFIYSRDQSIVDEINNFQTNEKYLPNISLNNGIIAVNNFSNIKNSHIIFIVVPVGGLVSLFDHLKTNDLLSKDAIVVLCSKGVEHKIGLFPTQIFSSFFPENQVCYLSGPNIAQEIALKLPTATDISSSNIRAAQKVASVLSAKYLRSYTHTDIMGSQVCACFKNVLAIGAGISDGREMGGNARAALLTRGVNELQKIIEAFGGRAETIFSLSGIGDIFLTCSNNQSRNMKFGLDIANGKNPLEEASKKLVEGYHSAKYIPIIEQKFNLQLPIFTSIYKILYHNKSIDLAVEELLARPKSYCEEF